MRRLIDRVAGSIRLFAAARAGIERQAIGVFENHANFFRRQAERFTNHLLADRVIARTDIGHAGEDIDLAIGLQRQCRARFAFRRAAIIERHAPAAIFLRSAFLPAGGFDDALQHFAHENIDSIFRPWDWHRRRAKYSSAQFESIDAHLLGDDVHLRLEREHDLRTARRARLGARHLIGIRAIRLAAIAGQRYMLARRRPPRTVT